MASQPPAAFQARKVQQSRTERGRLRHKPPACAAHFSKVLRKEAAVAGPGLQLGKRRSVCKEEGLSGKKQQEQRESQERVREPPGRGRAGEEAGHGLIGVDPGRLEPFLQTPPAGPALWACLEGVAPDLLT